LIVLGLVFTLLKPEIIIKGVYTVTQGLKKKTFETVRTIVEENNGSKTSDINTVTNPKPVAKPVVGNGLNETVKDFVIPINESMTNISKPYIEFNESFLSLLFYKAVYVRCFHNGSVSTTLLKDGYIHRRISGELFKDVYYKPIHHTWIVKIYDYDIVQRYGYAPWYTIPYKYKFTINDTAWSFRLDGEKYLVVVEIPEKSKWYLQKPYYIFTVEKGMVVEIALKYYVHSITKNKIIIKPLPCPYNLIGPLDEV